MRNLFVKMLALAFMAVIIVSCGRVAGALGMKEAAMDTEDAVNKVKEVVTKNVDAAQWKIYEITWSEGEKLGNGLSYIQASLVNKENDYFEQIFTLNDEHEFVADEVKEPVIPTAARDKIIYDEVVGIDFGKLDGKLIVNQLEAAKTLIPEEYEFKSVESYAIEEDVHRVGKMDEMLSKFNKEKKQYGKQSAVFKLNVLKKGEGSEMKGRQITTSYYTISFNVKEDGGVEMTE